MENYFNQKMNFNDYHEALPWNFKLIFSRVVQFWRNRGKNYSDM